MKYGIEPFGSILDEALPMFHEHFEETAVYQDVPLDVDVESYVELEGSGMCRTFTARTEDGKLAGYAIFLISGSMHRRTMRQALQDSLFVSKEHRGLWIVGFLKWIDSRLKDLGVDVVIHNVTLLRDYSPILERCGYEWTDKLYSKRLDA